MTLVHTQVLNPNGGRDGDPIAGLYTCDNCKWPNVGLGGNVTRNLPAATVHSAADISVWYPERASGRDFPDVPAHIASAADEAYRCRSFNALRAAVLMSRSVIESTCKEKEIVKGNLATKIDNLAEQGHIRAIIQAAAHEIRFLGNDMAHGDFIDDVIPEEADEILNLMSIFLDEVFQTPNRIERAKSAREAKKAAST
ncbi:MULTISPECIES: DUF4145 domain-containing protein [unclassified Rhodococcus (in: high G+C Gram-positive bacteria)]|uniref:DUF4145 domain-containing protein n=1 Tax=unclassified Rhodococcus (in: high G+C Gram-positive bacteria) TaxID=192944 RepID=UPI0015F735FF|nr:MULTISPECIES: DUF4145 domain-containing protein [unclassified Rhodococcus (in: high G+C Gram-positive bacteria)]MDI9960587.1 DUF4145 domain-containing protein [Rhodococcus sp. IEGM 1237]MDI9966477.1 DUF4145 domain-containing protein [Rhodococcus sp. IEGM 1251]MDV8128994.1 DUF4145 domain-containing protein [Rhodococcus sp. IEGM 1304]